MKTTIITALLLFMNGGIVGADAPCETKSTSTMVYICTGSNSIRYHKTSRCRGLSNCSGDIIKISIEEASQMGRTACKICYNTNRKIL